MLRLKASALGSRAYSGAARAAAEQIIMDAGRVRMSGDPQCRLDYANVTIMHQPLAVEKNVDDSLCESEAPPAARGVASNSQSELSTSVAVQLPQSRRDAQHPLHALELAQPI